jgi:hypothetical protein
MNYSYIFTKPIYFTPIIAYGLMVENYTDYTWKTIKMKNNGHDYVEGNITVEIKVDMENATSGELILFKPYHFNIIQYEYLYNYNFIAPDNNTNKWAILLRILYHVPLVGEYLLNNWLYPYLEPYNRYPIINEDYINPGIRIIFI